MLALLPRRARGPALILSAVVGSLWAGSLPAARAQTPLKKTLPNGLTVLVAENHAAPVVAVRLYVKTGSIYEGQYLGAGISHLFEHTLSEGTAGRTKEQISEDEQSIGGQSNAYTSKDVTAYHITTASAYFNRALADLADQVQHANFPAAEVATQQGVIHNEMNLDEDDPQDVLNDLFYQTAFLVHPVRFPIIGYRESFDRLTREDIVSYYKSHYTPENTVVSIAGDVQAERAMDAVTAALSGWERRSAATPAVPEEPLQTAPRRAVLEKDVNLAYLQLGWHTVPLQHPDLYALDVLAQIMGGGESSRLVRQLRERSNLVSAISASSSTPNYNAGVWAIEVTLPPANLARVESSVWAEVARLWRGGVTAQELHSAQRQIAAAFVFNNSNVENQAEQMAYDELGTGDPAYSRLYVARINAVTPRQVQAVALRYLTREGLTAAIVRPRLSGASRGLARRHTPVAPPRLERLPNGMRLIIRENHSTPTVSIVATGLGGVRFEPAGKAGVANLCAEMLTRGTARRTTEQIAATVDSLGGALEGSSGYNSWSLKSQWLAGDWRKGMSLVQESLLTPTFPPSELARVKAQVAASIQQQQDDPVTAASLLLRYTFFGHHPYGRSPLGNPASLRGIISADLRAYWQRILLPASTVLAVYGDVNPQEVRRVASYAFGGLRRPGRLSPAPPPVKALGRFTENRRVKPGVAQAALWFGYPSIGVHDPDRFALDVLDAALSGADLPGGRLHARLRNNQLVYVVHAYDQPGIDAGMFVVYAATTAQNVAEVRRIIEEELQKVRDSDISPEELARAKTMTIAAHAIANQTNLAQAADDSTNELLGLGYRETARYAGAIDAVTLADVRRVAVKYLRPEAAALATVEPVTAPGGAPGNAPRQ